MTIHVNELTTNVRRALGLPPNVMKIDSTQYPAKNTWFVHLQRELNKFKVIGVQYKLLINVSAFHLTFLGKTLWLVA